MVFSTEKQGKKRFGRPRQISELISGVLDPLMQQRAGMTMQLVMAWEEIAGHIHADYTRPEKLEWPKQMSDDEPFQAATLRIACEGARAIYLQHETSMIIERVNSFFGFNAIDRIKIVQKSVKIDEKPRRQPRPELDKQQRQRLSDLVDSVEDEKLKQALSKMGEGVFSERS